MRWALNKFYYSHEKNPLVYAYRRMLQERYLDSEGVLRGDYPTYWQFRYFFRQHRSYINQSITRDGKSYYARNVRPVPGDARQYAGNAGVFLTDATVADIYVVNRLTRTVMGRPNIYVMVDAYTNLVTGLYVGFESGENAVRLLMLNLCADKVAYCAEHGVTIEEWQWPSHQLPHQIIADRGHEYTGAVCKQICETYGIELTNLPPYRPDLKGIVERFFDTLQSIYKEPLAKDGVIRPDYAERGAPDYRSMAALDLEQFTQIVVEAVVYYNSCHAVKSFTRTPEMISEDVPAIPAALWRWCVQNGADVTETDHEKMFFAVLPRIEARLTRRGLILKKLRYNNKDFKERFVRAGIRGDEIVTVAYVPEDVSRVWLVEKGSFYEFSLCSGLPGAEHISLAEVEERSAAEAQESRDLLQHETQMRIELLQKIDTVRTSALSMKPAPETGKGAKKKAAQPRKDCITAPSETSTSLRDLLNRGLEENG